MVHVRSFRTVFFCCRGRFAIFGLCLYSVNLAVLPLRGWLSTMDTDVCNIQRNSTAVKPMLVNCLCSSRTRVDVKLSHKLYELQFVSKRVRTIVRFLIKLWPVLDVFFRILHVGGSASWLVLLKSTKITHTQSGRFGLLRDCR